MASTVSFHRLPAWIILWLLFTSIVVTIDAVFVLFRPASFEWPMYKLYTDIYIEVDKGYGDLLDGFVIAQSWLNLAEMLFNLIAVFHHLRSHVILSNAWCFIATLCTFWKTVIYLLRDACGGEHGFIHTGHNPTSTFIAFYVIPNAIWIVVPFLVLYYQFNAMFATKRSKKKKR